MIQFIKKWELKVFKVVKFCSNNHLVWFKTFVSHLRFWFWLRYFLDLLHVLGSVQCWCFLQFFNRWRIKLFLFAFLFLVWPNKTKNKKNHLPGLFMEIRFVCWCVFMFQWLPAVCVRPPLALCSLCSVFSLALLPLSSCSPRPKPWPCSQIEPSACLRLRSLQKMHKQKVFKNLSVIFKKK